MSHPSRNMHAGKLDRRITFQSSTQTRDAMGGVVLTWADVRTVWADYTPELGREAQQSGEKFAMSPATFRVRYASDIDPAWRIVFGGTVYEITAPPVQLGRKAYLDIAARATSITVAETADLSTFLDLGDGSSLLDLGDGASSLELGTAA